MPNSYGALYIHYLEYHPHDLSMTFLIGGQKSEQKV